MCNPNTNVCAIVCFYRNHLFWTVMKFCKFVVLNLTDACRACSWYPFTSPTMERRSWLSAWYRPWNWVLFECSWRFDWCVLLYHLSSSNLTAALKWSSCSFVFFELGPHLISFRPTARNVPLQASMTVTDGQWLSYFKVCFNYLQFDVKFLYYANVVDIDFYGSNNFMILPCRAWLLWRWELWYQIGECSYLQRGQC